MIERTGAFNHPCDVRDEEYADTRARIRRAVAEGTVLLKNDGGLLPLPALPHPANLACQSVFSAWRLPPQKGTLPRSTFTLPLLPGQDTLPRPLPQMTLQELEDFLQPHVLA